MVLLGGCVAVVTACPDFFACSSLAATTPARDVPRHR